MPRLPDFTEKWETIVGQAVIEAGRPALRRRACPGGRRPHPARLRPRRLHRRQWSRTSTARSSARKAVLNVQTAAGLTTGTEARHWTAVSNLASSGQTIDIWLRDSQTSRWFYLDNPAAPREMTVRQVSVGG
jgi:hypothetical protein